MDEDSANKTNTWIEQEEDYERISEDLNAIIRSIRSLDGLSPDTGKADDNTRNYMGWRYLNDDYWDYHLEYLSSEVFDRWDEYMIEKHIDFPLAFILLHRCCSDVYWDHEIHILVVPLGNNFFLMDTSGENNNLMHFSSAGCTNKEFNSGSGLSFDLLYASKRELSGINNSVFNEFINKEYVDNELCEKEAAASSARSYSRNIKRHRAFFSSFSDIIIDKYNPGGSGTYVREVLIGRIAQPYFAQMIKDMKGCVGTIDPFRS